ncbi:helix-turn-helix domain-containing protein [Bacillaceae bacterium S4-13-56]
MFITLILDALERFQGERGEAALFHLLKGKKSAQTIQDVHTFHLEGFYGLFPGLQRDTYQEVLNRMFQNNFIQIQNDRLLITKVGMDFLDVHKSDRERVKDFRDINMNKNLRIFLERLHLMIQMYSNLSIGNHKFTPITDHLPTQKWVKNYYLNHKSHLSEIMKQVYVHLYSILESLPHPMSDVFVLKLTGSHRVGLSMRQLAKKYSFSTYDIELFLLWTCQIIWTRTTPSDILNTWFPQEKEGVLLTQSAQKTMEWYEKGYLMEEIASLRGYKLSTIQDHIVEMALSLMDFPLDSFLTNEEYHLIEEAIQKTNSHRLRHIKEKCPETITYFQIRLTLAKVKGRREV